MLKRKFSYFDKLDFLDDIKNNIKEFQYLIFEWHGCCIGYSKLTKQVIICRNTMKVDKNLVVKTFNKHQLFLYISSECNSQGLEYQLWQFQSGKRADYIKRLTEIQENLLPF